MRMLSITIFQLTALCSLVSASAHELSAQGSEPIYLTASLEHTAKKNAAFFRVSNGQKDGLFVGATYAMDGKLKAEGTYQDEQLTVAHGSFVFYHPNGQVESRGDYVRGRKAGLWERFDAGGNALAEKVYDPEPLENILYTRATIMPRYPEGDERAWVRTVKERAIAPGERLKAKLETSFVVEKSGALSDVKVIGAKDAATEQRVADAIRSTAPWEPGRERGLPVRVQLRMPVQF